MLQTEYKQRPGEPTEASGKLQHAIKNGSVLVFQSVAFVVVTVDKVISIALNAALIQIVHEIKH